MDKTVKIGVAGCGNYGRNLIRFLARMEDRFTVTAICDSGLQARETALGMTARAKSYSDYSEFIRNADMDAVIIATPNSLHAEQAVCAMRGGLDVYLEKPVGCTIGECRLVADAMRATKAKVMVGMQLRYGETYVKAKKLIEEGAIGTVKLLWYKEFRGPFFPGTDGWRISPELSGGTIVEKNVHHLDLFNDILSSAPVSVYASAGSDAIYQNSGMFDNALMVFDYENGARALCGLSLFSAGSDSDVDFYAVGTKGVMEIGADVITVKPNYDASATFSWRVSRKYADMGHGGTEYGALNAFYDYIVLDRQPLTGIREGILSVGMAIAAQVSAKEHRIIPMSEILGGVDLE